MPKGKRKVLKAILKEIVAEQDAAAEEAAALCNHRNAHYTAGELTCTLPKGHGGDHVGYVGENITAWSDAAGKPARKHD